jgi:hypothetical protein
MSIFDTVQKWGEESAETLASWSWIESSDERPKTQSQQSNSEKLAEGSGLPQVDNAQNNTGAAVSNTGYAPMMGDKTTLLIGGGILVVVLLFVALMMGRK